MCLVMLRSAELSCVTVSGGFVRSCASRTRNRIQTLQIKSDELSFTELLCYRLADVFQSPVSILGHDSRNNLKIMNIFLL
jgi:hypothetical protein